MQLTVVIPTLDNDKGLNSLLSYFKNKPFRIIVVDNKKKNLGFAGGVNKGSKNVKTRWLLILNDDVEFYDQASIKKLIKFAEKNKFNAVSPILVNQDGKVENYGYKVLQYGKIELIKSHKVNKVIKSIKSEEIDGLTAACLLIKSNVFKKLGGFDESFFAYLEDVDFFLRFKKEGYKMAIAEKIKVLHNHMTTSKKMGNFKSRQDMINWWRLAFKHREKFNFNLGFFIERLRNLSGYLKATFFSSFFFSQKNVRE